MDKKVASPGLIRLSKSDFKNSFKQESRYIPKREEHENFAIDTNEFPSLAEVSDEKGKRNNNPLESSIPCFSYSDKLKSIPQESRSNLKVEHENLSKSGYVSSKEHSSKKKNVPFKKDKANHRLNYDCVESDNISNQGHSKGNFMKNPSDIYNSRYKFERKSYETTKEKGSHVLINQPSDKQPGSSAKIKAAFKTQSQNDPIRTDSSLSESIKSVELSSVHMSSKDYWVSKARAKVQYNKQSKENSYDKTSYSQITNKVKASVPGNSYNPVNEQFSNRTENIKIDNIFNNSSTNKTNTAHKSQIVASAHGWNSSEIQNNNPGIKSGQVEVPSAVPKRKKKRKSKVKRQAAMQTGKIFVLTPEAHSKIINQSSISNTQVQKNIVTDINDSEEYPELGSTMIPKSNKEYLVKAVDINIKKDIPALSDGNEVTIGKTESCLEVSENVSPNIEASENVPPTEGVCGKDQEKPKIESNYKEKSSAHTKDRITISLFDMLLSAKSKKKEPEKKNEASTEDSPSNALKNFARNSAKKVVSQFVNPLDSSRPALKRGKEREKPKIKRPSRMRKLILLGRKLKRDELTMEDENKTNNGECVAPSEDTISPLRLHEMDKDAFFIELCSGGKNAFSTFDENEEVESMIPSTELSDCKRGLLSKVDYQDTSLQDQHFSEYSLNGSEDVFSSDRCAITNTLKERISSPDVSNSHDSPCLHNPKESDPLKNVEKSSSIKFTPKPQISNRLAAQFLENSTLHNDDHNIRNSLRDSIESDYVFQEVKCVLENILLHVENENQNSVIFEKRENNVNCSLIEKEHALEDNVSKFSPDLKHKRDANNCKSKYYSISKDNAEKNELFKIEGVFYNITESSDVLTFDSFGTASNDSPVKMDSPIKEEPDETDTISNYSKNDLNNPFEFVTSSKNENMSIGSLKNNLGANKTIVETSELKFNSDETASNITNSSKQEETDNSLSIYSDQEKLEAVKIFLHTRKFRQYCNHFISKEIDKVVFALLDDLARFQDRMHQKDPVKARIRKRLLYGIKEITRHMKLKKLKCIIIATDIEDIKTEGGLNDVIKEIISLAEAYLIPYIFSHRRFNLGKVCRKAVPVSCVGIFNYDGSENNFKRILELQTESKHDYIEVTRALMSVLTYHQITEIFKLSKGLPEKIYELRALIIKEHFSPVVNENGNKNASEISTNVKSENYNITEELENSNKDADPEGSSLSLVKERLVSLIKRDTKASKEFNKNEIYNILKKYNLA